MVNATGFRLGVTTKWKSQWFVTNKNIFSKLIFIDFEIQRYIKGVLLNRLTPYFIGDIVIVKNSFDHLYILIFYYKFYKKKKYQRKFFNVKRFFLKKNFLLKNNKKKFTKKKNTNKLGYKHLSKKLWFYSKLPLFFIKKKIICLRKSQKAILNSIFLEKLEAIFISKKNVLNNIISEKLEDISTSSSLERNDSCVPFRVQDKNLNISYIKSKSKILNFDNNSSVLPKKKKQKKHFKSLSILHIKKSLQCFVNSKVSIVFVDLLNYIKFYTFSNRIPQLDHRFHVILKNKIIMSKDSFKKFIFKNERRNRRHVSLVKDVLNILYISFCLKQPQMLVRFLGYQFMKSSRKKKHTKLLKVLLKGMRVLMSIHKDVLGFKIKMKGRVNGKRRARFEVRRSGILPLQKQTANIFYGSHYGITKYGSLGIKIWMYSNGFIINDKQYLTFLRYFAYNYYNKLHFVGLYNKDNNNFYYDTFYNYLLNKEKMKQKKLKKKVLKI